MFTTSTGLFSIKKRKAKLTTIFETQWEGKKKVCYEKDTRDLLQSLNVLVSYLGQTCKQKYYDSLSDRERQ